MDKQVYVRHHCRPRTSLFAPGDTLDQTPSICSLFASRGKQGRCVTIGSVGLGTFRFRGLGLGNGTEFAPLSATRSVFRAGRRGPASSIMVPIRTRRSPNPGVPLPARYRPTPGGTIQPRRTGFASSRSPHLAAYRGNYFRRTRQQHPSQMRPEHVPEHGYEQREWPADFPKGPGPTAGRGGGSDQPARWGPGKARAHQQRLEDKRRQAAAHRRQQEAAYQTAVRTRRP